jgi:hypothetical protein
MNDKNAPCTAVVLSGGKCLVDGKEVGSPADLTDVLLASGTQLVEITVYGNPGFDTVGKTIYAVARSGAKMKDLQTRAAA